MPNEESDVHSFNSIYKEAAVEPQLLFSDKVKYHEKQISDAQEEKPRTNELNNNEVEYQSSRKTSVGWTKTGIELESWGKRSTSKDAIESLSKRQRKSAPVDVSSEVAKKPDFDIKGFSSSDEDESGIFEPTKTHVTGLKRAFSRSLPVQTRKRQKKCETPDFKDVTPIRTFQHRQSESRRTKKVDGAHNLCKWKTACDFEKSFSVSSFSVANVPTASRFDSSATLESPKRPKRKDERSEDEDIAWSDSDCDQPVHGPTENRQVAPRDKIPKLSPVKKVGQDKEIGQIETIKSDLDKQTEKQFPSKNPSEEMEMEEEENKRRLQEEKERREYEELRERKGFWLEKLHVRT